jgi:CRP-like cAMP-binding protein
MRFETDTLTDMDLKDLLKDFPIFSPLDENELNRLTSISRIKIYKKNRYVFRPGDSCQYISFLIDGTIKVGCSSTDGREVIKSILHPRAMFGEESLFGCEDFADFAKVISSEATLILIRVEEFRALMANNNQLNFNILNLLGKKLKKTEHRLESLIFNDARTRIINFIKDNAKNFGRQVGFEMLLKHSLTQQDIANFTGTSRQTVTSVLNDLKKSNQIYFKRKSILIRDMATLS